MKTVRRVIAAAVASLALAGPCWAVSVASETVRIADTTLQRGETVIVPVTLSTDSTLTLLSVDLEFSPRLCGAVDLIEIRAGDSGTIPEEGGNLCENGILRIVLLNLRGDPVAPLRLVPLATGERGTAISADPPLTTIANVALRAKADAGADTIPIEVKVKVARNRGADVELAGQGATLTISAPACAGDCDGDGAVAINELITGVNIALGSAPVSGCPSFDTNSDGGVAINELVAAVNNALNGCPTRPQS